MDHTALEHALAAIREVMTHINEDKRKTEGQKVMFDIFNDIDNCPVSLLTIQNVMLLQSNYKRQLYSLIYYRRIGRSSQN